MTRPVTAFRRRHHAASDAAWRDPAQVVGLWDQAGDVDPRLLKCKVSGDWWGVLDEARVTLLVTREYEHLVMAMTSERGRPCISYLKIPHPSGIAVDRRRREVYLASTRNPNQVVVFSPSGGASRQTRNPLMPARSWFFPGRLYLHDLEMMPSGLVGAAAGMNAIVCIDQNGSYRPAWWPASMDGAKGPRTDRNYLQLNSVAAGDSLKTSFFTASAERAGRLRPGHRDFPVKGRGVVFDGNTRAVCCRGLTRPHSARLRRGVVWVLNSGYGEYGRVRDGGFEAVAQLPGWTRGLAFSKRIAFIGVSRVLPRFQQYAPGLDIAKSLCGVFAVDAISGEVKGSIEWPSGNQLFGIACLPRDWTSGFPFSGDGVDSGADIGKLFYDYENRRRG
jgi:uncharacterized protein (TIGR03032 family)